MTPSKACKDAGLKNLKEMEELSKTNRVTLTKWFHKNRERFDILLLGCQLRKLIDRTKGN